MESGIGERVVAARRGVVAAERRDLCANDRLHDAGAGFVMDVHEVARPAHCPPYAQRHVGLSSQRGDRVNLSRGQWIDETLYVLTLDLAAEVSRMDNIVDRLDEAIKLFVTKVTRESLEDRDGQRAMEVISFSINLEHIGDIIDKNLMQLAAKKIKRNFSFSTEGAAELRAMHQRVLADLTLAFSILLSGDVKVARQLLAEKTKFREAEIAAAESHLSRLREERPESMETSALHLDVLRDLKRIHSHICAAAYPVLEAAGELRDSRLKESLQDADPDRAPTLGQAAGHSLR